MGRISEDLIKKTKNYFQSKKILTVDQIAQSLKSSIISARRRLKEWAAFTSYNKKGRYYTLPNVPEFDKNGIWFYRDVFFTKHRNLKQTIVYLVVNSSTGMSSKEIGEIVGLDPTSFMHHFRDVPGIRREKHQNRFIYYSDNAAIYTRQRQKRVLLTQKLKRFPSNSDAIVILVQLIKHPNISMKELSNKLSRQGVMIEPEMITRFLEYHELLEKKTGIKP